MNFLKAKKGSAAGTGAAIFTIIVIAVIVDALLGGITYSSALATTIKPYVVPGLMLGAIVLAIAMARSS